MIARIVPVVLVAVVAGVAQFARQQPPPPQDAPSAPVALAPSTDREAWAVALLSRLGNTQPSAGTVAFVVGWQGGENTEAAFNPLATTQGAVGDTCFNYIKGQCGVRNYPDYETGLQATAETIQNGYYPNTLAGLVGNQPIVDYGELGTWGTGGSAVEQQWQRPSAKCLPTTSGAISAHFNDTNSPYWAGQAGGRHNGTDYAGSQGEPVYAPFDLHVEDIQYYGDAGRIGWYVQGRFSDGYLFYAGHLGTTLVRVGEDVPACAQIGTIGQVFHTHIKTASPDMPVPCEATGCVDFEIYWSER